MLESRCSCLCYSMILFSRTTAYTYSSNYLTIAFKRDSTCKYHDSPIV